MKKPASCIIIFILLINPATGQSWNDLLKSKGPVKYSNVVKAFENEKKEVTVNEETPIPDGEFENEDHLFYKWQLYNKTRLDGDGNITNTLWRTLQAETEQQQLSSAESLMPHGSWQSIGPTDINSSLINPVDVGHGIGRVNSITFSGSNIFLGTASGGAWKGAGSNTWQSISENIPNLSVTSICVNPLNTNIIYLLTGDGDGYWNGPSNTSIGVIKSMDGGVSWAPTGLLWTDDNHIGFKMVMHPVNPETLYVASNAGIFMTLDGGANWSNEPGNFTDIEFKPGAPASMYAVSSTHFYLTTTSGIGGWTQQSQPVFTSLPSTRLAIAVSANKPNWVYVLAGSKTSPYFLGLWLSTNSGVSFGAPKSSITPCIFCDNDTTYSLAHYAIAFTANPADAKDIWMGGVKVFNSLDSGKTWIQRSSYYSMANNIMHPDIHALEFNAAGELWCGNDGGIFKYTPADLFKKWSIQFEGLNITQFFRFGLDATPPYDNTYFGAQDNGINRYDGDANFETVSMADGGEIAVDYITDKFYFNLNSILYKSCPVIPCDITPNTAACNCLDSVYNKNAGVEPNRPIKIDPLNNSMVYHGLQCLWHSQDFGSNFSIVQGFDCSGGMIYDFDVTPVSKWAVKEHKVFRETTPGFWIDVTNGLSANTEGISRIAAHSTNPLEAYVCYSGYNSTVKVFYTIDGGTNWNSLSAGLPNTPINDIIYQDGSSGGYYAATDIGVYYINENMFFWIPFRNGMPSVVVTELEINYGQNKIYASTYGRGGWMSDLIEPCPATDQTSLYPSLPSYSTIQANNTLTANSVFNRGFGQNVTLLSGLEIIFTPGFEASNGTELTSHIQNCPALKPAPGQELKGYFVSGKSSADPVIAKHVPVSDFILAPNPAKEFSMLNISLKESSNLKIEVVNMLGEKIGNVTNQINCLPGNYRFTINVRELKNGVYFIKSTYNNISRSDKLIVTD